jgi:hypothetical protein
VEAWLNGAPVAALTRTQSLRSAAVARLQMGDISSGRTFDLAFDDVVVSCRC